MHGADRSRVVDTITPNRLSAVHVLSLTGLAVIGIGILLPWVGETGFRIYVLGMESGFERQWGRRLLLGAALGAVLVLASLGPRVRWTSVGPIVGAIGAGTVLIAVYTTPLTGRWSPDIGVYVTLVGGLLVAGTAIASLVPRYRRRP